MDTNATVICIGNEIMLGHIANTNAEEISKGLTSIGIKAIKHVSLPDDIPTISLGILNALYHSGIVIITGGLGPTVDDLTLEAISKALDRKLVFNKKVASFIKEHFKKRHLAMPKNNLHQAYIPKSASFILNTLGTAPGLVIPVSKKVVIALPGVPFEMRKMLKENILPYLNKKFKTNVLIKSRVIKIVGLSESKVNEMLLDILRLSGNVEMGIYPYPGEILVKITVKVANKSTADKLISKIEKKIVSRMKNYIFGYDFETLEGVTGKLLLKNKKTLAIAESCTGGLVANRITNIPGSSKYFMFGVVTYSNYSKNKILNIPLSIINKYGAVSKQVASLMAKNVRLLSSADIGIGISGILGPGGSTKAKPVGLVYIAVSSKECSLCNKFNFLGDRLILKQKISQAALNLIRLHLHG